MRAHIGHACHMVHDAQNDVDGAAQELCAGGDEPVGVPGEVSLLGVPSLHLALDSETQGGFGQDASVAVVPPPLHLRRLEKDPGRAHMRQGEIVLLEQGVRNQWHRLVRSR